MIWHPIHTPIFAALLGTLSGLWWLAEVRDPSAARAPARSPVWRLLAAPARVVRWWVAGWCFRRRVGPPVWRPGELPELARQVAGERDWAWRFRSRREQLLAARRLRQAGYHATLAGRVVRLP